MEQILNYEEKIVLRLRSLYEMYGYQPYKMSKFEEYDLYAENKRFLVSKNVITFTDTSGKLMALKPDVTLSIVKNCKELPGVMEKVCYDESVYRASGSSHEYQEITQTGLECIGEQDDYTVGEVVILALKSLAAIRGTFVLDVSHVGFLEGLFEEAMLGEAQCRNMLRAIGSKSESEIRALAAQYGMQRSVANAVCELAELYGPLGQMLTRLEPLCANAATKAAFDALRGLYAVLKTSGLSENVNLDFSMTSELEYYNGVVFKGYVDGVPSAVLSGGRYDRLMEKLGKHSGAIGFAVYLNLLERLDSSEKEFDVDVLVTYDDAADCIFLTETVEKLVEAGNSVKVQRSADGKLRYRRLMRVDGRKVEVLEAND